MTVQLIGVGSQSRLRQVLQTNMDTLKEELNLLGIHAPAMPAVADTQQRLQQLVAEAVSAGQSVIVVGGIGEGNDLTVSTVCKGLGVAAVEDKLSLSQLAARCKAAGQPVPAGAHSGVLVPEGATVFRSRSGGWPGSAVAAGGQCILMLPDDPAELRALLDTTVFTYLSEMAGCPAVRHRVGVSGLPAGQVSQKLEDMTGRRNPTLTVAAGAGEVVVRLTALGQSLGEAAQLGAAAVDTIRARLGSCVYGVDCDGLGQVLAQRLKEKNAKIAVAEEGTGGALAAQLGQSGVLAASAGANELGLGAKQLRELSGQELAVAMADAARRQSGAALGLAAVAEGQENGRRVICLALADRRHAWTRRLSVNSGNPAFVHSVAANQAMNMARLYADRYNEILPGARELSQPTPGGLAKKAKAAEKTKHSRGAAQEESGMKKSKTSKEAWWTRIIPVKGDSKREIIRKAIFWVAIVVFICSIAYILSVQMESKNNAKLTEELGGMFVDDDYEVDGDYPDDYLKKFAALWERNPDIAGWIEIEGTQVNYPVVQTMNNSYYERRDFDKKDNNHGVPFVDYRVDQKEPSANTVIYAHNMNDGQMFGELMNYKQLAYYKEHPTFRYDSVYKENTYKIIGVFLVTANDPDFMYHSMINMSESEMVEYVNQVRSRSLINTKVDVTTTDKLVTMSTCDYSFKDADGNRVARFVVVGRAVREGEDATVDTSVVTLNANPVMPTEWYEQIARNQAAADLAAAEAAASQAAADAIDPNNIEAWLTEKEIESLLAEGYSESDLQTFADERRIMLSDWLTDEEMSTMTAKEKLNAMYNRRDRKWLSSEDQSNLSDSEKEDKIDANRALARQWLTEEEINEATSWKQIEALIAKKQENSASASASDEQRRSDAMAKLAEYGLSGSYYDSCLEEMLAGKDSKWDSICKKYQEKQQEEQSKAEAEKKKAAEKALKDSGLSGSAYDKCLEEMLKHDQSSWKEIIQKHQNAASSSASSSASESSKPESSSSESSSAESSSSESSESSAESSAEGEGGEDATGDQTPATVAEGQEEQP